MALLWGTCYDPMGAAVVVKSTLALLPQTAIDTTNLRAQFTAPANGIVLVRMQGCLTGMTTYPSVLFGVMQHVTPFAVIMRAPGAGSLAGTAAANTFCVIESQFLVTGLTPGAAQDWDASYGVEVISVGASSGIKYGGPNDSTGTNAAGGFCFEVWST